MLHITILYAKEDGTLAAQIAAIFQQYGYQTERKPQAYSSLLQDQQQALKQQIQNCDLALVLWNSFSARSQTVNEQIKFAQYLQKSLYLVQLDEQVSPPITPALIINTQADPQMIVTDLINIFTQMTISDIVQIQCPRCKKTNAYKLPIICREQRIIIRGKTVPLPTQNTKTHVYISCMQCFESFTAQVDCNGYI